MKNSCGAFETKKSLGQNFLNDAGIIDEIVKASGAHHSDVAVEIGPGLGILTDGLADTGCRLFAVELDDRLIPILRAKFALKDNVSIIHGDILQFDWAALPAPGAGGSLRIIGNLPYYITTPILLGIMEKNIAAASISVMVQKEVAERITAAPGGRDFGVLSVSLQYYAECEKMFDVPAEFFTPQPKVDSAVINLYPKKERTLTAPDESVFFALVKQAFSQRRKTLLNSMTGFQGMDREHINQLLTKCNIDPARRAETLSVEDYISLTKEIRNA